MSLETINSDTDNTWHNHTPETPKPAEVPEGDKTPEENKAQEENIKQKQVAENLVIEETKESLIQLRANIDNSNNFFEKNENQVTYHLDKVQEYLSNQTEKPWSDLKRIFATTVAVQIALEALDEKNYQKSIDGIYGADTVRAVTEFQTQWNKEHPDDTIKVDGFA